MACLQENNTEVKRNEKRTKYRQLAFELKERRVGYKIIVVPLVISSLGRGIEGMICEEEKIFGKTICVQRLLQKCKETILMDSETTIPKVLSGRVQSEHI